MNTFFFPRRDAKRREEHLIPRRATKGREEHLFLSAKGRRRTPYFFHGNTVSELLETGNDSLLGLGSAWFSAAGIMGEKVVFSFLANLRDYAVNIDWSAVAAFADFLPKCL